MTVLADVYTAIHHVIKPLILIADGSKVNSHISGVRAWRVYSVRARKEVWQLYFTLTLSNGQLVFLCMEGRVDTFRAWFHWLQPAMPCVLGCQTDAPCSQQCRRGRLWVHIVWEVLPCALGCAPESSEHGTARRHSHGPLCQWAVFLPGFTLQLAKAVQINLPLALETRSVPYWTVKF